MSIIKCKMCGGDLEIAEGLTVAECEYCGTKQTVPTSKDEGLQGLFNRANTLRLKSEFDRAESLYEKIIQSDETQAEAYWGIILCKYGIEYVEDPTTFNRVPTCHRASFDSVVADEDYKSALKYADAVQKSMYESEAAEIDRIQKEILALSKKEEPYDVFICYKETDDTGKRTQDSVIANDIYHQLTQEGFKVFYAAITLENKLGSAYEPCIFAALNSANVMLAIGTKPEYFNAVWVKNEWSRFLKIIKKDSSKLLIPCYRDMDAYELPDEFAHLQAQDMSKIGFINDLVRGIKKVLSVNIPQDTKNETVIVNGNSANTAPLLQRAFMFLEDGEWKSADEYCEKVLDLEPQNAEAYLGKLMAELQVKKQDDLSNQAKPFDSYNNYQKAYKFSDDELKDFLSGCIKTINDRNEKLRIKEIFARATNLMSLDQESGYGEAAKLFESIADFRNSQELYEKCVVKAEKMRKERIYKSACSIFDDKHYWVGKQTDISYYEAAINDLESLGNYKDSKEKIVECRKRIEEIKLEQEKAKKAEEEARLERLRIEEQERIKNEIKAKRNKKIAIIGTGVIATIIALIIIITVISNAVAVSNAYKAAISLEETGNYESAIAAFTELGNYKDSAEHILANKYLIAEKYLSEKELGKAAIAFGKISDYKDARQRSFEVWDKIAVRDTIASGFGHTVGLKSDGTVVAVGNNTDGRCNVSNWKDIVAISGEGRRTVGLKSDGTVIAVGYIEDDQIDVSDWENIIAISTGASHTVGLKYDGTVVATGENYYGQCDVSDWENIIAVSTGASHTIGLKSDGTIVAVGYNEDGRCDVSDWKDIVSISAGVSYTIGLKSDGTVVAVGDNEDGQCDISEWKGIVSISARSFHTIGLKSDGTVVAIGDNEDGQCDISDWKDIVSISAESSHTIGLKSDGTVVAVGDNDNGQCNVSDWTDIKLPNKVV